MAGPSGDLGRGYDTQVETVSRLLLENWDALGVTEDDGTLYLPTTIKWRDGKGGLVEKKILLRSVTNAHRVRSRVRARAWGLEMKLDLDRDADLFGQLENYELLAFAIRDEHHMQEVVDGKALFDGYSPQSLDEVWAVFDGWVRMQHPSFGTWDDERLWQVIAKVRATCSVTPLAVMPGVAQASCMLLMAREACYSPNAPSWLRSSVTSTPAL